MNRIDSLDVQRVRLVHDEEKNLALYEHFNSIMGTNFERSRRFNLQELGLPVEDLYDLERVFSVDEVWAVVRQMPSDKAPGRDGFTGLFYKRCCHIIREDIMHAVNAFWAQDFRSLNHLNEAFMVLIKKKEEPSQMRDFRPISLIHSFGKLLTRCLAQRLAPVLHRLVQTN